ncbi:MAG: hypothetical protein QOD28_3726 [Acidobacteriota bacterium]|nr:hypothetical protein [Acidobacteriota bacterium]
MRRKFGILFLIGITVLAGTQEAAQQFNGLKASLKDFTRASLWSGLIVYAQPVNDGKLPTPQIYYLMPTPQQPQPVAPAAQQPVLADNGNNVGRQATATTAQPDTKNNHGEEALAAHPDANMLLAAAREVEDGAKSELALDKLPLNKLTLNLISSHFVAPKADKARVHEAEKARVYEEVAKNEPHAARKFRQDADVLAKVFVREFDVTKLKEFDAEKIAVEAERLVAMAEQGQFERLRSRTIGEAESLQQRRMEMRVVRRPAPRPERPERIKVMIPFVMPRMVALPEMSSIGCEKPRATPQIAPVAPAPAVAPVAKTSVQTLAEPLVELGLQPAATGNTWTLNCDTEPEQK